MLYGDLQTIYEHDPAVRNWLEVIFCYPGYHALLFHRLAHWLYLLNIPFLPRFISHLSRFFTGIEIHPGATIGKRVFIDHGMGVVIGETAIIGDDVVIYQDVTLGGTGKEKGKRHPTIGKNVLLGAGAKVLGNIQIEDNVRIGAGSVVLRNVPANHTVVGVPGRIVHDKADAYGSLIPDSFPDPEAQVIRVLFDRIQYLEKEVGRLQKELGVSSSPLEDNHKYATSVASNLLIEDFLDGAGI